MDTSEWILLNTNNSAHSTISLLLGYQLLYFKHCLHTILLIFLIVFKYVSR